MIDLLLAAVIAGPATPPSEPAFETTIEAVLADPERFGGRRLRLRGQVDACMMGLCYICPEDFERASDGDQCLALDFDGFPAEGTTSPDAAWLMAEAFRYSVVTLEAEFDPSCLLNRPWPQDPTEPDAILVCADRRTDLTAARIGAVHRRFKGNQGVQRGYRPIPYVSAPADLADEVRATYWATSVARGYREDVRPTGVLMREAPPERQDLTHAVLCISDELEPDNNWLPTTLAASLPTPNNPYVCLDADLIDGRWIFGDR